VTATDHNEHPRPLLRRPWTSLDGEWEFAVDAQAERPADVTFDRCIHVPFAPETPASGIGETVAGGRCWYRRRVRPGPLGPGRRVVLHLGAVDRVARVWVDGALAAEHEGGYEPFSVDLTAALATSATGELEIVVRADDDTADLDAPRGKQDWLPEPHAIWYPPTTGIWRTVWLEEVPDVAIADLHWVSDPKTMRVSLRVELSRPAPDGWRLAVRLAAGERVLVDEAGAVAGRSAARVFVVGDGGIDDRASLLWWPRSPRLLDAKLTLLDGDRVVDSVDSYTALRSVDVAGGAVRLNGRPYPLRLVLDQGYWPETGMTPPDSDALRRDVELTRALGFNGARKHQKVEDPRYLAWADRLGLLVWVELPSAYRFSTVAAERLVREWSSIVRRARSHPSVIAWVPCNESWGVPEVEHDRSQRALVRALAGVADALDGTRPVSANDGWETTGGDIVGIHDYTQDPDVLRRRFSAAELPGLVAGRRWDGRRVDVDGAPIGDRAVVLSEFGGVGLAGDDDVRAWGYVRAHAPEDLLRRYREQWDAVRACPALAGACWTQLTDTYQEVNGLLWPDRTPKAPLADLAAATRGAPPTSG
jgi:beta-galactosidase/beta-glucuronidase